jgi:carbamoyl-phosphate synthase small subunit
LEEEGIVGIEGIDTRKLTLRVREGGAMRCGVSTEDLDAASLADRVREQPGMEGADLARHVSAEEAYEAADVVGPASTAHGRVFRVAAYDFGMKRNILRLLAAAGCEGMVFPAETPAETILADGFDGVFLSNGPGDPAATRYGVQACKDLLGRIPTFGICLGHQLLGLALGAKTYKLKFGHRGANQPVLDVDTGRVEVTSHNHGFAVDPKSFGDGGLAAAVSTAGSPPSADGSPPPSSAAAQNRPIAETEISRVALTHWNLNDNTLEGLRCLEVPAFSVQYHPEAAPGPHDARYLFGRFRELMSHA